MTCTLEYSTCVFLIQASSDTEPLKTRRRRGWREATPASHALHGNPPAGATGVRRVISGALNLPPVCEHRSFYLLALDPLRSEPAGRAIFLLLLEPREAQSNRKPARSRTKPTGAPRHGFCMTDWPRAGHEHHTLPPAWCETPFACLESRACSPMFRCSTMCACLSSEDLPMNIRPPIRIVHCAR